MPDSTTGKSEIPTLAATTGTGGGGVGGGAGGSAASMRHTVNPATQIAAHRPAITASFFTDNISWIVSHCSFRFPPQFETMRCRQSLVCDRSVRAEPDKEHVRGPTLGRDDRSGRDA